MTRARAEQLLELLAELEADDKALPPEYRAALALARAMALVEVTFADDGSHSRKVPPSLRVVS